SSCSTAQSSAQVVASSSATRAFIGREGRSKSELLKRRRVSEVAQRERRGSVVPCRYRHRQLQPRQRATKQRSRVRRWRLEARLLHQHLWNRLCGCEKCVPSRAKSRVRFAVATHLDPRKQRRHSLCPRPPRQP